MQNYTLYVKIFVAITSYNKILLIGDICNFTSQYPLAAERQYFEIEVFFPFSPILTHKVLIILWS
jgi:hypothetical protein